MPKHAQGPVSPHTIVTLPNTNGMQLLLCYDNEGVYVNTYGKVSSSHHPCSPYFELGITQSPACVIDMTGPGCGGWSNGFN